MSGDPRTVLTQDERPIQCVYFHGENAGGYRCGDALTVEIKAYAEHGQMGMVPWIAVYGEGGDADIIARIAAEHVFIGYI